MPGHIHPNQEGVSEIRVDCHKSTWLPRFQCINFCVLTDLLYDTAYFEMPWWSDTDVTSSHLEGTIKA